MALSRVPLALRGYISHKSHFSTSSILSNEWRKRQGLEPDPNRYGPLTNLPDFSYVDGRPVPLSATKFRKLQRQRQFCERISELTHEIDVGLQTYYERQQQMKQEREERLKSKLKPKGQLLLKKKPEKIDQSS